MADSTHEKYCKHSKYANRLCELTCRNREAGNYCIGVSGFSTDKFEVCAIPSQQVEVIEKDLIDRTIDGVLNISDDQSYYCQRGTLRKLLKVYGEAIESEKKPCEHCQSKEYNSARIFCSNCGRKLR